MHNKFLQTLLLQVVFPGTLLITIAVRPFGMSLVYLLLFFLTPPLPLVKRGNNSRLLKFTAIIVSPCMCLVHLIWHIALAMFPPYGSLLDTYPLLGVVGQNLGLVRLKHANVLKGVVWSSPEFFITLSSITLFLILRKRIKDERIPKIRQYQAHRHLTNAGKYVSLFFVMFSGIIVPSVTSGIYFLLFLILGTWWTFDKGFGRGYAVLGRCLMPIMALHTLVLLVYQCTWILELVPPDMNYARYFGLTKIVEVHVSDSDLFWYQASTGRWETFTSPIVILLTYYILGLVTTELFKPKVAIPYISTKVLRGSRSETTPLMRTPSTVKSRWPSIKSSRLEYGQGSSGTIVVDQGSEAQAKPTLGYEIGAAIIDFCQILVRSSYIAATIIMMAWSILYHSWLTFVLLMWANIVWLTHNQRKTMLKTSPLLVFYAMILLIIQYIYGMNLTEDELPSDSKIEGINFNQIGISRPIGSPCVPLLIKTLFTCMFWITLRQSKQEAAAEKQEAVLADWAAPVTVSTAPSVIETHRGSQSRLFIKLGIYLRWMCARFWIYVVAIMLFVIGITGDRMTIFRIIYMFLFLVFILLFQISWTLWRRLMYMFWIVVIMYSMINLILIYVYQFDKFSKLIEVYLLINTQLQYDLGLARYAPGDLFVKLLTPTCFLIITIIQVHYFHKDFMTLSDPEVHHERQNILSSRKFSQGASTIKDDIPPLPLEGEKADSLTEPYSMASENLQRRSLGTESSKQAPMDTSTRPSISFRSWLQIKIIKWKHHFLKGVNLFILYLEIHLMKIIFFSLMALCTFEVCALHVPIMIVICPALWMNHRNQRRIVLLISTLITIYFMMKMVYQINYIEHRIFNTNCSLTVNYNKEIVVFNNAEWFGFIKAKYDKPLVSILKGYIGLIAIFTLHSLVSFRQASHRKKYNLPETRDKLMFPRIRREDADKDFLNCVKYLVNYGFYKFGVEISLIGMMVVIGSRMDMYSVIYSIWLLVLVTMNRRQQARVWYIFTGFLTIIIPLQYLLAVGILPYFCVEYPWSGTQMKHIRSFVYLPYNQDPPYATKLIFDYILLLCASLQFKVFRRETIYGETYPGGSNSENIGQHWETPNFVNPIPDFTGFVGSWLDVVKRMVFLGMLWVTLAIMFMTGTNRVNLFSMGYLIGSFIFLWQGTDFYLLPKDLILLWWSWLLRYNVTVVLIKALLQIAGCIFGEIFKSHACWLVQLLGIGCVDKFAGGSISKFIKMEYKKNDTCTVPQEDIGLAWDGVCFAFLILQKRLFHSYYFYRVIDESKATTVLASRGAELIEHLRQKQMLMQEEQEKTILKKIKIKMERIKANQKKIQGISKEPVHHEIECDEDGESEQAPLVRGDSDASGRGYHTPDSPASPRGFHTPLSEASVPPSPRATPPPTPLHEHLPPAPLPSITAPLSSHGGPPSPSSALLTSLSLDAYLEPRRISFESPPSSDLLPRAQSPEESYPVFSPPPIRRRHTVASPSVQQRTSVISQSSRSEPKSHHTSRRSDCPPYRTPKSHQQALRSGDYYMFEDVEDADSSDEEKEGPDYDSEAVRGMGLGTLVSTIVKTDLKQALIMRRRASMPAVAVRRRGSRFLSLVSLAPGIIVEKKARSAPVSERDVQPHFADQQPPGSRGATGESPPERGPPGEIPLSAPPSTTDIEPSGPWFDKFKQFCDIGVAFGASLLISITRLLLRYSRDYRYVSRTLTLEKKILKEREGFGIGIREGTQQRWEPLPESLGTHRKLSDISVPEIRILAPSLERGLDVSPAPSRRASPALSLSPTPTPTPPPDADAEGDDTSEHESAFSLQSTESKDVSLLAEQDDSMFKRRRWPIVHVIYALWYAILAHTDIVCYIMVFINQIQSATILSIPLPLMVFLWGTLTIPRPTKTFWVTLIAYTEVIVLIKSMFQFEILPWNQKVIPADMPFTAPRIIGIERKSNYAVYDLLLLLIIFLHRFMLKSLGLWKESTPEIELREDMEFQLTPEDTSNLVDGKTEEVGRKYVKIHNKTGPQQETPGSPENDPNAEGGEVGGYRAGQPGEAGPSKPNDDEYYNQQETPESPENDPNAEGGEVGGYRAGQPGEAGPSKPNDDEYYNVNDDQEPIIAVTTTLEDPYAHCPRVLWLSLKRYLRPPQEFFKRMLQPMARVTADIYAYMFLCDFTNFLVVIFGFAAFGTHQGDGGVQAYLEENKVPIPFLVMLILQFALIVIDRALYLRKFMLGKILFQYCLIIGVHVWMFFVLPFITERTFNTLLPPPLWYMVKCVYLLLSAYQIRCGYPRRIIGNFLCKSYRFLNMVAFRGFMAVPFVFELRTLMDWIWTDTSMTLMDWLKMEDIFASVYLLKCGRYIETEYPQKRGAKKPNVAKYLLGGGVLMFVIAIIWFPLVFFAFGNTVGEPNPPTDVTVKIRIGPFLPVYQMSAQSHNIYSFTEQDYSQVSNMYTRDRTAQTFLSNYMYNDVAVIILNPNSTMRWSISPPEQDRLEREAESNAPLKVKFTFVITHPSNNAQNPPTIEDSKEVTMPALGPDGNRNLQRDILYKMLLNQTTPNTWLTVPALFPKFLKVFNKGTAKPVTQLDPFDLDDMNDKATVAGHYDGYHDVQMRLERDRGTMYWRVKELCSSRDPLMDIPMNNCDMLVMYTFNEKLFPETLNFISGGGIIGLYTTFVFLASRVIRGFFSGIYTKIMFDDLPNVDRVLQLCLDIYLVREALELSLEEDLFAKLVFLYRSPETMIKWSRPKDDEYLQEAEQRALPPSR